MELTRTTRFAKLLPSEGYEGRLGFENQLLNLSNKIRKARDSAKGNSVDAGKLKSAALASTSADAQAEEFRGRNSDALIQIGSGKLYQSDREADFPLPAAAADEDASSKGLREVLMHGVYGPTEFERAEQISRMQESFNLAARNDMRNLIDLCNEARSAWQHYKIEGELATNRLGLIEMRENELTDRITASEASVANVKLNLADLKTHLEHHCKLLDARSAVQLERQNLMSSEIARLDSQKAEYQDRMLEAQKETDAFLNKNAWRYELSENERKSISEFEISVPAGLDLVDQGKWGVDIRHGFYSELNQALDPNLSESKQWAFAQADQGAKDLFNSQKMWLEASYAEYADARNSEKEAAGKLEAVAYQKLGRVDATQAESLVAAQRAGVTNDPQLKEMIRFDAEKHQSAAAQHAMEARTLGKHQLNDRSLSQEKGQHTGIELKDRANVGTQQAAKETKQEDARLDDRQELQKSAGHQRDPSRTNFVHSDGQLLRAPGEGKVFQDGQVLTAMTQDERKSYEQQMANAAGVKEGRFQDLSKRLDERREKAAETAVQNGKAMPNEQSVSRASTAQQRLTAQQGPQKERVYEESRSQSAQTRLEVHGQKDARMEESQEQSQSMEPQQASQEASRAQGAQQRMAASNDQVAQQSRQVQQDPQVPQQAALEQAQAPALAPQQAPAPQRSQAMTR